MNISRNGSRPSVKGPAEHFTGTVRIDPLFQSPPPGARLGPRPTRVVATSGRPGRSGEGGGASAAPRRA